MSLLFGGFPVCLCSFFFQCVFSNRRLQILILKRFLGGIVSTHACLLRCIVCVCRSNLQFQIEILKIYQDSHTHTHTHTHLRTHPHSLSLPHTHTQQVSHTINEYQFGGGVLQRTATHCNTLQHTATHCNTVVVYRNTHIRGAV